MNKDRVKPTWEWNVWSQCIYICNRIVRVVPSNPLAQLVRVRSSWVLIEADANYLLTVRGVAGKVVELRLLKNFLNLLNFIPFTLKTTLRMTVLFFFSFFHLIIEKKHFWLNINFSLISIRYSWKDVGSLKSYICIILYTKALRSIVACLRCNIRD